MQLKGKITVVTGAGRGIGASEVKFLAGVGALAVLASRREASLTRGI